MDTLPAGTVAVGYVAGAVYTPVASIVPHVGSHGSASGFGVVSFVFVDAVFGCTSLYWISVGAAFNSATGEVFSLQTARGKVDVPGNRFRLALGPEALRSTLLVNLKAGKRTVWFEGRGWGHGVGLCQWGARGRALAGQSYKEILEAYYPKAKLSKV